MPLYTETEFEALFLEGKAPEDCIRITRWAWEALPPETRMRCLQTQNVVTFNRDYLGTSAVSDGFRNRS